MTTCVADLLVDLDSGQSLGYWAKGHHTGEDLLHAAKRFSGDEIAFDPAKVRQTYFRQVPIAEAAEWSDYAKFQLIESKPGRGAFPVTVYEGKVSG